MKKIALFLLTTSILIAFVACQNSNTASEPEQSVSTPLNGIENSPENNIGSEEAIPENIENSTLSDNNETEVELDGSENSQLIKTVITVSGVSKGNDYPSVSMNIDIPKDWTWDENISAFYDSNGEVVA